MSVVAPRLWGRNRGNTTTPPRPPRTTKMKTDGTKPPVALAGPGFWPKAGGPCQSGKWLSGTWVWPTDPHR